MFSALKLLFSPRGWASLVRRGFKGIPRLFSGFRISSRIVWRQLKSGYSKNPLAFGIELMQGAVASGIIAYAYNRLKGSAEHRVTTHANKLNVPTDSVETAYYVHTRRELADAANRATSAYSADKVSRKNILSLVQAYHGFLRSLPPELSEFALAADDHIGAINDLGLALDLHPTSDSIETAFVNIADDGQGIQEAEEDFARLLALDARQLPFKTA